MATFLAYLEAPINILNHPHSTFSFRKIIEKGYNYNVNKNADEKHTDVKLYSFVLWKV